MCKKECAVLFNLEASGVEVQAAALSFSDGIFDLQSEVDDISEADLKGRRLHRWDVQSAWLGYTAYQTVHHHIDSSALNALGQEGFPVLVVQSIRTVSEAQKVFINLKIALMDRIKHAPFHENPEEVMNH